MTSMTRSTPSTPICNPQLPPPTETKAGALQPSGVRQDATPRPCLPPKIKPPLSKFGTTTMHFAPLNTSSGMPLSGVDMIAWITSTDFCMRSIVSSRSEPAQAKVPARPIKLINSNVVIFFMKCSFKEICGSKRGGLQTGCLSSEHLKEREDTRLNHHDRSPGSRMADLNCSLSLIGQGRSRG